MHSPLSSATSSDKKVQLTGIYDLVAVLTHKGRSADSGHYVAWVKQESGQFNSKHIPLFIGHLLVPYEVCRWCHTEKVIMLQGNGFNMMMTILVHKGRMTSQDSLAEVKQ